MGSHGNCIKWRGRVSGDKWIRLFCYLNGSVPWRQHRLQICTHCEHILSVLLNVFIQCWSNTNAYDEPWGNTVLWSISCPSFSGEALYSDVYGCHSLVFIGHILSTVMDNWYISSCSKLKRNLLHQMPLTQSTVVFLPTEVNKKAPEWVLCWWLCNVRCCRDPVENN